MPSSKGFILWITGTLESSGKDAPQGQMCMLGGSPQTEARPESQDKQRAAADIGLEVMGLGPASLVWPQELMQAWTDRCRSHRTPRQILYRREGKEVWRALRVLNSVRCGLPRASPLPAAAPTQSNSSASLKAVTCFSEQQLQFRV